MTRWILVGLVMGGCWLAMRGAAAERELIRDPHFQNDLLALDPKPGKRVVVGKLAGLTPGAEAVWDLAQWSSKYPLELRAPERLPDGALRHANAAKSVILGRPGTESAGLALAVTASAEYGTRARKSGEPWVHLLLQQAFTNPPAIGALAAARLKVECRLKQSRRHETPDYSPGLHAAQFQIFLSVQNRNRQSKGYGQYLWFGIPLYDDRHRVAPAHKARDTGGTDMFIFTPAGDVYTAQSTHDRGWVQVDKDVLPLIREGLETAWEQGFLKDSRSLADYRISEMNLGWEVPGIFDVEMQMRGLSLRVRTE